MTEPGLAPQSPTAGRSGNGRPGWPERTRPRPVGVVAIALILLVIGASVAGLATREAEEDPIEITGAGATQRLLGGIPQEGAVLGSPSAPVTVEVFNDLQCPSCAEYHSAVVVPLVEGPVRDDEVNLVLRHFSLSPRTTVLASYAAAAAGEQGRQWQYAHLFFLNQDEAADRGVTGELLDRVAAAVLELDQERWSEGLDAPAVREQVESDAELAAQRRLPAEPAIVVHGPGGSRELIESPSLRQVEAAIAGVR